MKDYYKILGLKETASGEDIRFRWIELMRKLHSDRRRKGEAEDRRLKEINEAYGVLKHSSTRSKYDLKRTYNRKTRNAYLRRIIFPPAILIVLLILGLVYLKRPRVALLPNPAAPSLRGSIAIKGNPPLNEINQTEFSNDFTIIKNSPSVLNGKEPTTTLKPPLSGSKDPKSLATLTNKSVSVAHLSSVADQKKQSAQDTPPPFIAKSESSVSTRNTVTQTSQIKKPEDRESTNPLKKSGTKTDPADTPISVTHVLIAPNSSIELGEQIVQSKPASLIATEEEVREFFVHYIERYTQKDIGGFLSLFFSKAVQNGRYRFKEIKKIYSDFFDQSHKLRYHMEDTRIGIYQNAVHVKARYKVDQILEKGRKKKVWKGDIRWILVRENGALKIRYLDYKQQKPP